MSKAITRTVLILLLIAFGLGLDAKVTISKIEYFPGEDFVQLHMQTDKILPIYSHWKKVEDVNQMRLKAISHFFEHYKDLEEGKWVKVLGWEGIDAAHKEILDGAENYLKAQA